MGHKPYGAGWNRAFQPPSVISTSFPPLDTLTGCNGVPLGVMTLLSGRSTSGKVTMAYKLLANAQAKTGLSTLPTTVALVDMTQTADPDYLARCGVDLERLLLVRPATNERAVHLILDLARSRQVNLVVVDSLADLVRDRPARQTLMGSLRRLPPMLRTANCGLVWIDEVNPPWLRWLWRDGRSDLYRQMALHIELQREQWLAHDEHLLGYCAQANVTRSRWSPRGGKTAIEIRFNGTVQARTTW